MGNPQRQMQRQGYSASFDTTLISVALLLVSEPQDDNINRNYSEFGKQITFSTYVTFSEQRVLIKFTTLHATHTRACRNVEAMKESLAANILPRT